MEATALSRPGPHDRPQPDGSDVRLMGADDVPTVAETLADAFYDDPIMTWVTPNDGIRRERLRRAFIVYLERVWLQHELCYAHVRHAGAALWEPPGTWKLSPLAQLRLLPAIVSVVRGDTLRLMRFLTKMEKHHPEEPPHYYLPVIGVASAWQGRGFGSALLRPVLERCDAEGVPAYLEASTRRNRALYERHGFVARGEMTVGGSPPWWPMWREPVREAA